MTAIEQSSSQYSGKKWTRIVIWTAAVLDLAALAILLWIW